MVNIQVNVEPDQHKTINVFKAIHNLSTKQDAVVGIIKDWEKIQTLDSVEIQSEIIKKIEADNEKRVREIKNSMRKAYVGYGEGMDQILKDLMKKYKKSKKKMEEILDGDQYDEGEDPFMDKVWGDWLCKCEELQHGLEKENLKSWRFFGVIVHDESWFEVTGSDLNLGLEYSYEQYTEEVELGRGQKPLGIKKDKFVAKLSHSFKAMLEIAINTLRGNNSINNIVNEGKPYFEEQQEKRKARIGKPVTT